MLSKQNIKEAVRCILPTRLKAHRIHGGPLAGHRIYTSWHDYPGAIRGNTESSLLAWFARNVKSNETWLDVGAHYGYTAIALSRLVGAGGRVIAFEPVLSTAGCIARTRELNGLNQLQIIPLGLSSAPAMAPCRFPISRGMAERGGAAGNWHELIFLKSFDGLWESLCEANPTVHGLKIDVQGMEGEVLTGMTGMLRRWHPKLVVEFHAGVDRAPILDLLEGCGYHRWPEAVETGSGWMEDNKNYVFMSKT
jgi:FkbM family methyltransferase